MKNIFEIIAKNPKTFITGNLQQLLSLTLILILLSAVPAQKLVKGKSPVLNENPKTDGAVMASITVTTTADTIDAGGGACPAVTLASLPGPDGQTSLREAICAANSNAGGDMIGFSVNGTFTLTGAANENSGNAGDLDVNQSMTINGNGATNTIIDGGGIERIFDVFPSAAITFSLSGLTLQHGDTRTNSFKEGGALYLHNNVTTTITNCRIINNFSGSNAAIENRGTMTITGSVVSGNQTIPASGTITGGGIHNVGPMMMTNTTIDNNLARGEGGGMAISVGVGVTVNINNSTISNNSATVTGGGLGNGGGISTTGNQGTINLTNCTISGNHADNNGGGAAFVTSSAAAVVLTNVTITNNIADNDNNGSGAGGAFNQGTETVTLRSTIAAGNFNSTAATRDDISGAVVAGSSFNLVGDGTGSSGIANGVNSNQVGTGASPINAMLNPLGNEGGPTLTHRLLTGSPALDKGNSFGSTTDQRGNPRPVDQPSIPPASGGDNSDIGAYERIVPTAANVSVSGKVLTADGQGIRNAAVYLTSPDGSFRTAQTGTFGVYSFENVPAGQTYTLTVVSRRFTFGNPSQIVSLTDELTDLNFVAASL